MQRLKKHSGNYQPKYKDDDDDLTREDESKPKQREEKPPLSDKKHRKNKYKERLELIK